MAKKDLIQIRVTTEQKKHIKKMAIDRDMTISDLVLYAIMKMVNDEELTDLKNKYR